MYIHEGEDLYLAADQQTVVTESDPRAAFVLVARGGSLPDDVAERHGLKARAGAPANKLRVGPGENKSTPGLDVDREDRETAEFDSALVFGTGENKSAEELERPDDAEPGVVTDVEFTPVSAFEEALNEEKPKRRTKKASGE